MMRKTFIFFFSITICIGCINRSSDEIEPIKQIDFIPSSDCMVFSDHYTDYTVIQLQGILLSNIQRIIPQSDGFVILSASDKYNIHVFNENGEWINSFGEFGNGPLEFIAIADIGVHNDNVFVLDNMGRKLVEYSKEGIHLKILSLKDYYEGFTFIDKHTVALYKEVSDSKRDYHVRIYDLKNHSVKHQFFPIPSISYERSFPQRKVFTVINDTLRFYKPFIDCIYSIVDGSITPSYGFNYFKRGIPDKVYWDKKMSLMGFVEYLRRSDYIWAVSEYNESNKFIYLLYRFKQNLYINLYNKELQRSYSYNCLHDDLFLNAKIDITEDYHPILLHDDSFYYILSPWYSQEISSNPLQGSTSLAKDSNNNQLIVKFSVR